MSKKSKRHRRYQPPDVIPAALAVKRERDMANAYIQACGRYRVKPNSPQARGIARARGMMTGTPNGEQ